MTAEILNRIFIVDFSLVSWLLDQYTPGSAGLLFVLIISGPALGQVPIHSILLNPCTTLEKVNVISICNKYVEYLLCAGLRKHR